MNTVGSVKTENIGSTENTGNTGNTESTENRENIENTEKKENTDGRQNSIKFLVVSPEREKVYKDSNSASLTVLMEYKDFSLLLTGDSGNESEKQYVKRLSNRVSVLKVAHHGSRYSSSKLLLDRISPVVACVSCSKNNSYGHPAPETIERLEDAGAVIFRTYLDGCVTIRVRGGKMEINRFKR